MKCAVKCAAPEREASGVGSVKCAAPEGGVGSRKRVRRALAELRRGIRGEEASDVWEPRERNLRKLVNWESEARKRVMSGQRGSETSEN